MSVKEESQDIVVVSIYLLTADDGGRRTPIGRFYKPFLESGSYNSSSVILDSSQRKGDFFALGGEYQFDLLVAHPVGNRIGEGDEVVWREGLKIVAKGKVLRIGQMVERNDPG